MTSGLVVHVESGNDRQTEVLTSDRIFIGTGPECEVRLSPASLKFPEGAPHAAIELQRSNGHYRVAQFDPGVKAALNGIPLRVDARIQDGDEIRFDECDVALQFFPVGGVPVALSRPAHITQVAPFIENAAIESAATARRDDAKVFLREFTRELVREIKTSTKFISLAIALLLVAGILYIGFALYRELLFSRRLISDQQTQLKQMSDQVKLTGDKLIEINDKNDDIRDSLNIAPKIRNDYGGGVCLIAGSFYFVEQETGRPLRYLDTQTMEDGTVVQNGNDTAQLTPEGNGAIAEFEFVGTGFHVGGGYVLTNRHVAQPWLADERAQGLGSAVNAQPRLKKLSAFFPSFEQPFALRFRHASDRDDLAVCSIQTRDAPNLPVLPLDTGSEAMAVGKWVVMMGYPSGPDRLLALLEDSEARSVQARYGSSLESLLDYLSSRHHIKPLTTQGHITDLDARRVVYDARTAEGGSGAPLFGTSGRVIGINFAVFTENSASNFAVAARFAIPLLQRSGWKAPVNAEEKGSELADGDESTSRSVSPTSASSIR
jgi:serine protease Do